MDGIQMGMKERRDSFEDYMGKYQEKGLWGTSFGGDDVGYRTEGESKYSQAVKRKLSSGDGSGNGSGGGSGGGSVPKEFTDARDLGDFDKGTGQPGTDQKFRGGSDIGENAPNEYEEKFGEGGPPDQYSSYPQGREYENIDQAGGGMMNLGGSEEDRFGLPGKKKDNLGGSVGSTSGGMEGGPPQTPATSNKFADAPPSGGSPGRDNYRRALPDALAQAGLSAEERAARDVAEKQELLKEKYLVGQKKKEYGDQMKNLLAKRKTNKLKDLVSSTFRN
jgi:hypothetical protein